MILGTLSEIPTRRDARVLLEQRLRPLNQGTQRPQSTIRFQDFVEREWKMLVLPTLKLSTQHGYQVMLRNHVLPYFGDRRLCEIAKCEIQQFITEKFRQELAWQTVRNAWIVLSTVLYSAVEYEYLTVNPARGIKFPPQGPRPEPKVFTANDLKRLLGHLEEPYRTMVALAVLTGIRFGELLALRWRCVNFQEKTLRIAESVFLGKFQPPKSEKSIRIIPLGPITAQVLQSHYDRSIHRDQEDLAFPRPGNTPYRESNLLQQVLQPAAVAAGLGHITWHQLRHVHASVLHDLGVPVKIAQKQLGHATVETTLNIYTHAIPETHRRAVEDLERVLSPNVPKFEEQARRAKCVIQ